MNSPKSFDPHRLAITLCVPVLLSAGWSTSAHAVSQPAAPSAARGQDATATNAGNGGSDAERRMRIMLMQRSMGFGGIFGGLIAPLNRPSAPRAQKSCSGYSDSAACSAYRNGDQWAADRLQRRDSTPSERDWYSR